ncbi:ribonuclease HI [Taylorella equigenitalis]|uniref:Ribonuclease H n=2 Tax=Taylorella equigenitalis TaxID=29575 RepID=A0A654KFX4_TAYEM|nr:ribonuclease HI [Taylorella equigenitalis]ADU91327.1 Ribonuclease HI [Taylorella equigenitalis MCE9]ASY30991.1 ribonuclease HI [Taylorella equigenitalis]ASY38294.1 ribonuclease HI [Taylorella equigenitalis]ASY42758.1 ribonuclease HI [Taylorella equigenitalis]KGK33962.1 ribonuclease H [Taylorella equigenitalis]
MSKKIEIWTDGACKGNPGVGGWGALIILDDVEVELKGAEEETTNNRMELTAVIMSLQYIEDNFEDVDELIIHVDSQYVMNPFVQNWLENWQKQGWKTASKTPVKNKDLWQELIKLVDKLNPKWNWVRGHCGIAENERADELANLAIKNLNN